MNQPARVTQLNRVFTMVCLIACGSSVSVLAADSDCSAAITNSKSCVVTFDREQGSSPLPIRLSQATQVTIVVTKRPLETVSLGVTYADVATPDPLAAVFSAFAPSLQTVVFRTVVNGQQQEHILNDFNLKTLVDDPFPDLRAQLQWIDARQRELRIQMDQSKLAIDSAAEALAAFQSRTVDEWQHVGLITERDALVKQLDGASTLSIGSGVAGGLHEALITATKAYAAFAAAVPPPALEQLRGIEPTLNAVAANQALVEASAISLAQAESALRQASVSVHGIREVGPYTFRQTFGPNPSAFGRTATIKVTVQDVVSMTTTNVGEVTLTWSSTKWEVSVGTMFSLMPNRTYANSPVIVGGKVQLDASGAPNTVITESDSQPSVIPFALAHYRLQEWGRTDVRWAVLATGGVGISPYSGSTDLAFGGSLAYRSVVISPLGHLGRDLRLTNGLMVGNSLGSSPPTLMTERFWHLSFGVGLSLRIF